jgi:cell division inhibitor SepF
MRSSSKGGMEVCMIKPTSVDDGVEICDTLRSGRTVVINLEGIPTDVAQRIIDFASGACYAMNGNMQPISNFIVLATPKHVELTGDFNDVVSGNGLNVTSRNN